MRCTDLLRRILWVSDYEVTSDDLSGWQTWVPGRLSPSAPIGSDAFDADARKVAGQLVRAEGGKVWWCDTKGAVLADGIWAGTIVFGAIVNLTGRDLPRLTIDRRTIIGLNLALVEDLLRAAIPALMDGSCSPLSHRWLSALVDDMPRLADEICARAIDDRYRPWRVAGTEMPIEIVGCFPHDESALAEDPVRAPSWDDRVGSWRLTAWLRASPLPSPLAVPGTVVPARPSDNIVLRTDGKLKQWLSDSVSPDLGHVLSAALRAGRSPAEVAERLALLGYTVPAELPADTRATDPLLLSMRLDGEWPWLSEDMPVPHHHVLLAALTTGLAPHAVAERLIELRYVVPSSDRLPAVVHPTDKALLNSNLDSCVTSGKDIVPVGHMMVAAAITGRTPLGVVRRLAELGYRVPDADVLPPDHGSHDGVVFAKRASLYASNAVPLKEITDAAIKSGRPAAVVAARLTEAATRCLPTCPSSSPRRTSSSPASRTSPTHGQQGLISAHRRAGPHAVCCRKDEPNARTGRQEAPRTRLPATASRPASRRGERRRSALRQWLRSGTTRGPPSPSAAG